jgi:SAM-dependent methyltransferase
VSDHYADGTYRWWHLSRPPPELLRALAERWLPASGRALDIGCGLGTEAGHLHRAGWRVVGVDLSAVAVATAAQRNPGPSYLRADLRCLPLRSSVFDAGLDRGCFQYLAPEDRPGYAAELRRVLRPGGKLLLRASLRAAGIRNDIDEDVIRAAFASWRIELMQRTKVPSDTRLLDVLLVRLTA